MTPVKILDELDKQKKKCDYLRSEYESLRRKKNKQIELMEYQLSLFTHCMVDYLTEKDQLKDFMNFKERWDKKRKCLE